MKKTFCIFSANYLPNIGGVEKYTKHLAEELVRQGDKAIVVTNNVFDLEDREQTPEGVEIVRLPCFKTLGGRYPLPFRNALHRALTADLRDAAVDFVVINTRFYPHSLNGVRLAESIGIRPVVIDHGSAHLTMGNKIVDVGVSVAENMMTSLMKRHDVDYYGVSKASVKWLEHFGIDAIGVLNNSIDAEAFAASSSGRDWRKELGVKEADFVVVFTGRLIPEKGIASLVEAAEMLSDVSDIKFLIAGDGPMRGYVERRCSTNLIMLGNLSASDIAALLLTADAFCLPTRSEGFSTSLLEAAACSVTPILPKVGGVEELITSEDFGIVLRTTEPEEVMSAVRSLYDNRVYTRLRAANLHARVLTEFSWKKTANKVREACEAANGQHCRYVR